MRRRATTGVDGTRGVGFCFFLGGCSGVGRVLTTGVGVKRSFAGGVIPKTPAWERHGFHGFCMPPAERHNAL